MAGEQVRIDKWLWAVRIFKTRAAAKDACVKGRVRLADAVAKPASRVAVGDQLSVRTRGVTRTYRIRKIIDKRVGAAVAADCVDDLTPPEALPPPTRRTERIDAAWAERSRGSGRPTKKERREMERFLGGRRKR